MSMYVGNSTSSSVSTLFSSLSTSGTSGLSSVLSDYNSIRSGSYKKLLSSYYATYGTSEKKTSSGYSIDNKNENKKEYSYTSYLTSSDSASTLSKVKNSSSQLSDSIATVMQKGTKSVFNLKDIKAEDGSVTKGYDKDSIYDALSSFVNNYNSTINNAASSSVSSIKRTYNSMLSSTSINEKTLNKIGISINSKDNTLSIDKDKFNSADMSTVKSLFNSAGSYAYSIASSVSQMNAYASYEAGRANTYTNGATYSSILSAGSIYDSLF